MKLKQYILTAAVLMAAITPIQVQAATKTATMNVSTSVISASGRITVDAPLNFGVLISDVNKKSLVTTTITVSVTTNIPYTLSLNNGLNSIPSLLSRYLRLTNQTGPHDLRYDLYSDMARFKIWGDGSNAPPLSRTGTGLKEVITVYAKLNYFIAGVFNSTNSGPAGTYSDVVTATLTY